MRQDLKVLAACLAIFAVYLPIAHWLHQDYVRASQPAGRNVELLGMFWPHPDHYYAVRPRILHHRVRFGASGFVVYEDLTPLPRENFETVNDRINAENGSLIDSAHIRFRTSDGSDPRSNGRKYWLVAP